MYWLGLFHYELQTLAVHDMIDTSKMIVRGQRKKEVWEEKVKKVWSPREGIIER